VLRTPAEPVTVFDAALRRLVADMIDTMYDAPGVGLAAPQVGVGLRLFVFDVEWDTEDDPDDEDSEPAVPRRPLVVANPVLETGDGEQTGQEGCLSVPKLYYSTTRADTATVRGVDADGAPVEYSGSGLLARCFQHEVDHLDGTLYLDRLTGDPRRAAQRALRENGPDGASAAGSSLPSFFRSLRRK
jgi:peptide deformylase